MAKSVWKIILRKNFHKRKSKKKKFCNVNTKQTDRQTDRQTDN